jgi:hypothetical protein
MPTYRDRIKLTDLLLPGEDPAELEALRDDVYGRLAPADGLERLYAERVVAAAWRLQRALAGEARIFARWGDPRRVREAITPAQMFATEYALRDLDALQGHVTTLERAMDKAMAEFARLQKARRERGEAEAEGSPSEPGRRSGPTWSSSREEARSTGAASR